MKFEDVEGKTPSEIFIEEFSTYYKLFQNSFNEDRACEKRLREWRGWVEKKDGVKWKKCPKKGCDSTRAKLHKDNKENPLAKTYRCINTRHDRHEFSLLSKTIFHNTRSPLWFWYLTIYSLILLEGNVPFAFLKEECRRYADKNSFDIKELENNLVRIIHKVTEGIFRKKDKKPKLQYVRLVGLKPKKNYLEWLRSKKRQEWKIEPPRKRKQFGAG